MTTPTTQKQISDEQRQRSIEIAQTILQQMGGRRFRLMTGAHDFLATDSGLRFRLPGNARDGINLITITLTPADDYTMTFTRHERGAIDAAMVAEFDGVYCDQLADIFTTTTGLYTRL